MESLFVTVGTTSFDETEKISCMMAVRSCDLEDVMLDALVNDKPQFVRLFIDNGMNMYDFLTYGRLQELYCSISQKCLLYELLLRKLEEHRLTITGINTPSYRDFPENKPKFTLCEVSKVLKDFLHDACKGIFQESNSSRKHTGVKKSIAELNSKLRGQRPFTMPALSQTFENPWRDLFLWAVLQNRQEMANYFWEMGPEAVPAALAACKILKEMARLELDTETARSMKRAKYDQLAINLFSECYANSEDRAFNLLIRETKYWGKTTCLQLATEADAKSFFAHDGVQALLTKIWWGEMSTDTPFWKLLSGFCCPPLIFTNLITFSAYDHISTEESDQTREQNSFDMERALILQDEAKSSEVDGRRLCQGNEYREFIIRRWKKFWGAPVTVFLGNVILYFAFLSLFAYVLLVDFQPPPPIGPSMAEIALYFWVFTLALEELRQSFFTEGNTNIVKKFKLYVEDSWNKCDMVALVLFIVAVTCRMLSVTYDAGRTTLCLDFMVFALRLIHIFAINKQLGPKIIIVERMMKDVFFFLFFLSVWLVAYGVATQALLHPNETRVDRIFRHVLYRPYLQIFGQISLDEIDEIRMVNRTCIGNEANMTTTGVNLPHCINRYANWLVIVLLVIFLLVTNVLLLNLLIAMFSYTFQVVQGNTDIFWKFQRYNLIVEYHSRPALAPPLIIISHLNLFIRSIIKEPQHKREHFEKKLPEGLDQKIRIWESVQKENYLANLEKGKRESSTERLKKTSTKVDSLLKSVSGLQEREKRLESLETKIKYCSDVLAWMTESFIQQNLHGNRPPPTGAAPADSPIPVYKKQPADVTDCPVDTEAMAMPYIDN